jgi:hypothetical protein
MWVRPLQLLLSVRLQPSRTARRLCSRSCPLYTDMARVALTAACDPEQGFDLDRQSRPRPPKYAIREAFLHHEVFAERWDESTLDW